MTDIKISQLPTTGTAGLTDQLETNTAGGVPSVHRTLAQIFALPTLTYPLMNYGGYQLDGATDYLDGNALTGIADSKVGSVVIVVRFANAASATERIIDSTGNAFGVLRTSGGGLQIIGENAATTAVLGVTTAAALLSAAGIYVIMASWDLAVPGSARLYINDVSSVTESTYTDDTIDYTVAEYSIGASATGTAKITGDVYSVWFDPTQRLEFNTESVRRKFADAQSIPIFLGSRGELPTGTPPILFLGYSDFNNWPRNRGLATTSFVENGTPGMVGTALYGQAHVVDGVARCAVRSTAVGNVTTGEDNLITYALPASAMPTRDTGVHVTAWGTTANNANAKTIKLYFGSQVILTNALTVSIAGLWRIEADVVSTGTDTQDYVSQLVTTGTAGVALNDIEIGTATQDDGAAITIKCTGEATATNDIVQEGMIVTRIGI